MSYRILPPQNEEPDPGDAHAFNLIIPLTHNDANTVGDMTSALSADMGKPIGAAECVLTILREVAWEAAEDAWREMLKGEGW